MPISEAFIRNSLVFLWYFTMHTLCLKVYINVLAM